ncbi:MAG: TIM barrel protein, partial [Candidatus Poribacteria bacterium]|nr:TIM barrel protein [Candidatus Poribacteria bacterium]
MKASFCTNAFGNTQEAIEEAIPQLAEMGYDGLEFWEQYLSGADLKWLKGFVDEHQLEIVQICPYFDFTTSAETWERSIRDAERYRAYAVELGGPLIRTYTGNVGGVEALIDVL